MVVLWIQSHRATITGTKGTQTFYPKDDLPIHLKLMKGLMGFYISEPTAEDITTLTHVAITDDNL